MTIIADVLGLGKLPVGVQFVVIGLVSFQTRYVVLNFLTKELGL